MAFKKEKGYNRPKGFKVGTTIPTPINEQIDRLAAGIGMSKSGFVSMMIQLGIQAWLRSYSPEKLFTTDDWEKIMNIGRAKKEL